MSNIDAATLPEVYIAEIMPVWKKKLFICANAGKVHKGFEIVANWICCLVEYRLKHDTLQSSKRKLPDLERKIKKQ
jgi:hypothetical protein